jgi:hypothetical protein
VIEFAADVEKPLGKASKFTTGVVIFELMAKQLQKRSVWSFAERDMKCPQWFSHLPRTI